jgi:DNA-binding NarL/FixJ family response regulator
MSGGSVIAVALIEDNRLVCEGITALLNRLPDFEVVASASGADMALLRQVMPQVVLLDLSLRNGDGLRMAERVKKELPGGATSCHPL